MQVLAAAAAPGSPGWRARPRQRASTSSSSSSSPPTGRGWTATRPARRSAIAMSRVLFADIRGFSPDRRADRPGAHASDPRRHRSISRPDPRVIGASSSTTSATGCAMWNAPLDNPTRRRRLPRGTRRCSTAARAERPLAGPARRTDGAGHRHQLGSRAGGNTGSHRNSSTGRSGTPSTWPAGSRGRPSTWACRCCRPARPGARSAPASPPVGSAAPGSSAFRATSSFTSFTARRLRPSGTAGASHTSERFCAL